LRIGWESRDSTDAPAAVPSKARVSRPALTGGFILLLSSGDFAQIVHPVVRLETGHVCCLAVAITDRAGFHARAAAGFHIGGGIAYQQTVPGLGPERGERREDYIRRGLARKAVGALHVIEELNQAELLEDGARGGSAFSG